MTKLFDSHAHYYDARFYAGGSSPEPLLEQLFSADIGAILNVGTSLENAQTVIKQAARYPRMYAAIGIHPTDGQAYADPVRAVQELESLLASGAERMSSKLVAVGEIGLDYHYPDTDREKQAVLFELQLALAERLGLPVIIHDRDAHGDCFAALLHHPKLCGVLHSFSGSAELARELTRRGWYISFSGVVTFRNAPRVREAVAAVPLDHILIETDCPYLAPEPNRGKLNHSGYLSFAAAAVAAVKGVSPQELAGITFQNACTLFGIRGAIQP